MSARSAAFLAIAALISAVALGQHGLERPRQPNTELVIDSLPAGSAGQYSVVRAFPRLEFPLMTFLLEGPGDRIYVGIHDGKVLCFPKGSEPDPASVETFLDLSAVTCYDTEQGLMSLAFAPDYATSGELYVFYNPVTPACGPPYSPASPSYVSRFTNSDPTGFHVNPASEEIVLQLPQQGSFHQGGHLAFGPDGMLYISLGDGGAQFGQSRPLAQDPANLYGTIIRIDVQSAPDPPLGYAIPADNPFAADPGAPAGWRREVYAYGFRNPWRIHFDPINGYLFSVDVGEDSWEEVNAVVPGGNYGWGSMEGPDCAIQPCDASVMRPPIHALAHDGGANAIVGGGVYTGKKFPGLYGKYIFAHVYRADVYALTFDGSEAAVETIAQAPGLTWTAILLSEDGEVFLADHGFSGPEYIYRLLPSPVDEPTTFPIRLSDLPALHMAASGAGDQVPGVIPYQPASPLWSDNSLKERCIALPGLEQVAVAGDGTFAFPDKSLLVKNFLMARDERYPSETMQRIETRLLLLHDGQWHGFSYEWLEDESDGILLTGSKQRSLPYTDADGIPQEYAWYYPSRSDCFSCHTSAANRILGFRIPQLNHDHEYAQTGVTDNQLAAMDWISLFDALPAEPSALPKLTPPSDTFSPVSSRARAYLDANCSMCHQPAGPAPTAIDLRFDTPLAWSGLYDHFPTTSDLGVEDARIIAPGDPSRSTLYLRMLADGEPHRMPPLASSRVDNEGTELVRIWIEGLSMTGSTSWNLYE